MQYALTDSEGNATVRRLNSKLTFFYKKVIPLMCFGFLGFFVFKVLTAQGTPKGPGIPFAIVPIAMAVFIFFSMKRSVWDLIDEVYDEGATLLFRNRGREVRVSLRDIKNVSYSKMSSPPRVTLSIRYDTDLGKELSFSPPTSWNPFKKNKDIEELIDRIDRERG